MKQFLLTSLCFIFSFGLFGQAAPVEICAVAEYNGDEVRVDIKAANFQNISAYQFGIAWAKNKFTFESTGNYNDKIAGLTGNSFGPPTEAKAGLVPVEVGFIKTVWLDNSLINPATVEDGEVLFSVFLTRNDINFEGFIGVVPNEEFPIEFITSDLELAEYDISGKECNTVEFANLISDTEDLENLEMTVSPNPAETEIIVDLNFAVKGQIELVKIDGAKLMNTEITGTSTKVDLHNLSSGTYLLKIISSEGETIQVKKVIKI